MISFKQFITESKFSKDDVYYHGTPKDIKAPSSKHFGQTDTGRWGKATYWTDVEDYAQGFGKNVIKAKLNLKDPLVIKTDKQFKEWHAKIVNPSKAREINDMPQKDRLEAYGNLIRDSLLARGYDGVVDYTDNNLRARKYGTVMTIAVFNDKDINVV